MGSNKLTSEGAKSIAEGLVTNTKLHFLQLNYQQIGNKGAKAFKAALEVNFGLITLHLGGILRFLDFFNFFFLNLNCFFLTLKENKVSKVLQDKIHAMLAQEERRAKRIDSVAKDDDDDDD